LHLLEKERATLAAFFPKLDETLAQIPLLEMEKPDNPALGIFRKFAGPKLLIPTRFSGLGATPLQAIHIQRALGSRSPSLAVATTMHHWSIAIILEMFAGRKGTSFETQWLENIAENNLYVSSAFAEGVAGSTIFDSKMEVKPAPNGLIINGSKKPCSLTASMDILTAAVLIPSGLRGDTDLVVVAVLADSLGIERRPFWNNWILAGAESDEVILHDVFVPDKWIANFGNPYRLDVIQARCIIWFELLISATYLGIATALVERTIAGEKGIAHERVMLAIEVEGAMAALEGVARWLMESESGDAEIAHSLYARYAVQRAIERATNQALELLGGMAFAKSADVSYLFAAARALAYHPPSRLSVSAALDRYLAGNPLTRHDW
jgi:alkylation response protein AidB-like acyl-CoA dehydrogenase